MAGKKLLLPYNFSDSDRRALEFTVEHFGPREEWEITLFHGYTPLPSIEVSGETVTGRLKDNFSYLNQKITELESALQSIKRDLVQRGIAGNRIKSVFKPRKREIAAEILNLHAEEKFQIIVLNRKPGRIGRFFTGSVHGKLMAAIRNSTVCVVC
jgi:hypothetical protein